MEPEKAIETLKALCAAVEWDFPLDYAAAIDAAIEALEKQIPEKPRMPLDAYFTCPVCERHVEYPFERCTRCGQAIDWR